MKLTIQARYGSTIVVPSTDGYYNLTEIARELRYDFPESKRERPEDWLEANPSGLEQMNQVKRTANGVLGTLMAVYAYIDWINSRVEDKNLATLTRVFSDNELATRQLTVGESLDLVHTTLETVLETVCGKTYKAFESDNPTHDVAPLLYEYDNSIHLKAIVRNMLAILEDGIDTARVFDDLHAQQE